MAHITHTLGSQSALADRFGGWVASFKAARARRRVYRTTLNELRSLSDRELADLGLNRCMLQRIAYQAAQEV